MADNTQLNTGAGGDTIGTDDVAGIKYQVTKAAFGADGSMTRVDATNPLPATIPDGKDVNAGTTTDAAVTTDVNATLSAKIRGILKLIAGVITGDRVNVNVIQDLTKTIGQVNQHALVDDTFGPTNLTNFNDQIDIQPLSMGGGAVLFAITGTWTGTISFIGATQEGSTTTISAVNVATGAIGTTATVNGKYRISSGGFKNITARLTVVGSGTAVVEARTSQIYSGNISLDQPIPAGSNVIGQVTANAGTNLNTSALALEAGNLASIKAKTDNIPADPAREGGVLAKDASLTTIDTDIKATQPRDVTDRSGRLLGHVTVDSMPPSGGGTEYTDGATTTPPVGKVVMGVVTTTPPTDVVGEIRSLSVNTKGQLRVSEIDNPLQSKQIASDVQQEMLMLIYEELVEIKEGIMDLASFSHTKSLRRDMGKGLTTKTGRKFTSKEGVI